MRHQYQSQSLSYSTSTRPSNLKYIVIFATEKVMTREFVRIECLAAPWL